MVWLEDPLCGDVAHRGVLEEEDEQTAQELAAQYMVEPVVQWTSGAAIIETTVFLVGQAACLLTGPFFQETKAVGSISVPELVRVKSPMEEEYGSSHKPAHTCAMSITTASGSGSGGSSNLLLVECPRELPQEQAATWAQTVLAALQPRAALIAATLPSQHYRGPGSPADDDLVFGLQTAAAAAVAAAGGGSTLPPPLPEATLVGGLAAALLTGCELRQLPAVLVAGVQMQQVPDAQFLYTLGQAVQAALGGVAAAAGGEAAEAAAATGTLARQQSRAQLLAALAAAADAIYRSSASSSIFS